MDIQVQGTEKTINLPDEVFAAKVNAPLVHQVLTAFLAGSRQGSKAQKSRAEVSGGGRKPWRQKGTGRARAGSTRGPIWRHGGVTFAAKPRDYTQKLNKKMYRAGMRAILSSLLSDQRIVLVEAFAIEKFSTKQAQQRLQELDINASALLVVDELDEHTYFSVRNLPNIEIVEASELNPWLLLRYQQVVITEAAIALVSERFGQ